MEIHTPHYLHQWAWGDPTHVKCFNRSSFNLFDKRINPTPNDYGCDFKVKTWFSYFSHTVPAECKLPVRMLHGFMTWFINRFPRLYDNWLVFLLLPPQEVIVELEAVK